MSATIKYKGTTLASITTNASKTLKTSGKYCEGDIVVENVQDGGITPTGNKAITATTSTQTGIDVTNYATVSVAPTPSETKSVTANGDVTPTSGKLLSKVTVNVPTGTARTSSDLTASGATVTVPAGLYASDASKSVASGTAGTPSASKGDVVDNTITVTPSVTNTTGYITGGTKTGTSVSVSASDVTSGNKSITATTSTQTDVDVTNYKTVSVAPTPSETKSATVNGDVTPSSGKLLSKVTVNVPTGTARSASDLTASGATVTVPAGLYSTQATKSVASGSAGTPTASKGTVSNNSVTVTPSVTNTTGYITGGTKTGTGVTVSASELVSGNKALTPSTTAQTNIDVKNYATASVSAITKELLASLDTDFVADNIKKDIDLFGLLGTLEGGGGDFNVSAFYGASKATSGQFTVATDTSGGIVIYHELGVAPKLFAVYPSEDSLAAVSQATGQRYTAGGMFISSKFVDNAANKTAFFGTDIIVAQINFSKSSSTSTSSIGYGTGAIGATGRTSAYTLGTSAYNPLYSSSGSSASFRNVSGVDVTRAIRFYPYAGSYAAYLLGGTTWNWIAVG